MMRHVFDSMGTVVSLVLAEETGDDELDAAGTAVRHIFAALDARFSLYQPDSEACRLNRGELRLTRASREMREAYALAHHWSLATDLAFTPHRPDGLIDLSGVVKALAMQQSVDLLRARGLRNWCLVAGGDVLTGGNAPGGGPWVVGIVDPADRTALLTEFTASAAQPAVATSGIAERGEHIWRQAGGDMFAQVSVAAPDIVTADVLATAIVAGGLQTLRLATDRWRIEVIAVTRTGECYATPAFRAAPQRVGQTGLGGDSLVRDR